MDEELRQMRDRELVGIVRSGDCEAFELLMDRCHEMVYGICLRISGSPVEADILAHDAFVEAYLKLDQLRDPGKFRAWLRQVALNICRMWYRQHKRMLFEPVEALPEIVHKPEVDPTQIARMGGALPELSPGHRLVLALHYFEGMTYENIAKFLDVPVGTVMSRLYRARQALKEALNGRFETEGEGMSPDELFKEEVRAEISLLLSVFKTQPSAMERLTVLLRRSPRRLIDIICQASEDALLNHLSLLVARLGPDAGNVLIEMCFAPDEIAAAKARAVLNGHMARDKVFRAGGPESDSTASAATYHLADMLIRLAVKPVEKAELLIDLMEKARNATTALLLTNLLMCYPREAFPILMQRFRLQKHDELSPSRALLALCRTGDRFCRELIVLLAGRSPYEQKLGLSGVEAVARCLDHPWLNDATPERFANEVRMRYLWPPLCVEDMDTGTLERMTALTAGLTKHNQTDTRNAALRVMGYLRADCHLDDILACVTHEEQSTRIEAIKALAQIDAPSTFDVFIDAARRGDIPEQQAAVEAIGRCRVEAAEALLLELVESANAPIQQAAVTALGEIGSQHAVAVVRKLLQTGPKGLKRLAARSLHRIGSTPSPPSMTETARRALETVRGEANPITYVSLDAAIRYAMPELRSYDEMALSRQLTKYCGDVAIARRGLVMFGLMSRKDNVCELTEFGKAVWRVEHFIMDHYLGIGVGP